METLMTTQYFDRFSLTMPVEAARDCSTPGQDAQASVEHWAGRIPDLMRLAPSSVRAELEETGAWEAEDLTSSADNIKHLLWIAACNWREGEGTLDVDEEQAEYINDILSEEED